MRIVKFNNLDLEVYDSIESLPMARFHKYNKMILIDAGVGTDLADFDNHIQKAMIYASQKKSEEAIQELENLRANVLMIQQDVSPRHLAFCALVKTINGEEQTDLSTEGLKRMLERFSDVPQNDITSTIEEVKKKIDNELVYYFPRMFEDANVKEFYDELRQRTMLTLKAIIDGNIEEKQAEIDKITMALMTYNKPQKFHGSENLEIQHDKSFENMCSMISQHLHIDAKGYTVLEYYSKFEYLKELLDPKKQK